MAHGTFTATANELHGMFPPLLLPLLSSLLPCVECDIVQADHAPDGGVAQGIIHGVLIRHHGRNQEEVEEGLGQEVKGQEEENAQETTKCTCMDGMR